MSAPLEQTFAGAVGRWRVVDKGHEVTSRKRPASRRFAVMALPVNVPLDGMDRARSRSQWEFELCAVQYRPHAEAIAALPELAKLVELSDDKSTRRSPDWFKALGEARAKAEGRAS